MASRCCTPKTPAQRAAGPSTSRSGPPGTTCGPSPPWPRRVCSPPRSASRGSGESWLDGGRHEGGRGRDTQHGHPGEHSTGRSGIKEIEERNSSMVGYLSLEEQVDADFSRASRKADRKSTRLNSSHANISYAV